MSGGTIRANQDAEKRPPGCRTNATWQFCHERWNPMRQRGRRSQDNLSVIPVENMRHQLQPPDHLSQTEKELFREVVASAPATHFAGADVFLLTKFAQVTALLQSAARSAAKANEKN